MLARVNFIGCGRLGKTIGKLLHENKAVLIQGIVNSSLESALEAVQYIGKGQAYKTIQELPPAEVYFIACTDDRIRAVCNELAAVNLLESGSSVIHFSGVLSSDILSAVRPLNCYVASIHPIKSFARPEDCVNDFSGTYCSMEGDEPALILIRALFQKIGALLFEIKKENKVLYHAAGVMANNYLVTLHYQAVQSYKAAGVDEKIAKNIASMLMADALKNLENLSHEEALTGPIERGDRQTVQKHLESLTNDVLVKKIYSLLGQGTLPLTKLSEEIKFDLTQLLKEKSEL